MSKQNILGHKNVIDYFKILHKCNRVAHTYLFIGKEGIGKRKVANFVAMLLNCTNKDAPCYQCDNCYKIDKGIHPDIYQIQPKNTIGIKDVRDIQLNVSRKKFLSKYKVVIIDKADKLTTAAANAFLKTLEEPPRNTLFFLISSKPENLFPTIRSRAHKLWLSLKINQAKEYLITKGVSQKTAEVVLQISETNLNFAEKIISKKFSKKREDIFSGPRDYFDIDERKRENLKETVFLLLSFLRDCLVYKNDPQNKIINADLKKKIEDYQGMFTTKGIISKINTLMVLNQTLDNVNINLANNLIHTTLKK